MCSGKTAITSITAITAIAVGEGCMRIWIAASDDDRGRPAMMRGWDNDGRRSAVVTASIYRACEGRAIGGGGHDDAASSGWIVVLGEHCEDQPLWRRVGPLSSFIYLARAVCGDGNDIISLSLPRIMSDAFANLWNNSACNKQPPTCTGPISPTGFSGTVTLPISVCILG